MTIFSRPVARDSISIESIADQILREYPKDDLEFIRCGGLAFLGGRSMVLRHIRNDFGLWEFDHPLTQHWHQHPEAREIIGGADFSEDHPDQISNSILEVVRKKL